MAPAHPHATGVAVYPALLNGGGVLWKRFDVGNFKKRICGQIYLWVFFDNSKCEYSRVLLKFLLS